MCWFIEPECLMANTFFLKNQTDAFEMKSFRKLAREIEKVLKEHDVMVCWYRPQVSSALLHYADMFERDGDVIRKSQTKDLFNQEFVDEEFNCDLPPEVVECMKATIKEWPVSV
ncbi:MAG: hypothetical protein PF904_17705 [Kiritimatiellae bacterium]|jgi:hypothetical protein|nr:hypothetical protein [Kiritimatiellia bacterium]